MAADQKSPFRGWIWIFAFGRAVGWTTFVLIALFPQVAHKEPIKHLEVILSTLIFAGSFLTAAILLFIVLTIISVFGMFVTDLDKIFWR